MKRIVVIGGAESGSGAAVLARKQGFDVFLTDMAPIPQHYRKLLEDNGIVFEEGLHSPDLILNADEVIKSPGVPDKAPMIQAIKAKGIPIISEIEFAGRYTKAKMICITGSNGKTTTTLLTYHILKNGGLNVGLAGNVGQSFALQVAQQDYDYYVIELSSFQLDYMFNFKADVAVMLNITPDHLDRYHYNLQEYVDAKFRIIQNQSEQDAFIYWNDDPIIQQEIKKRKIRARTYPFSLKKEAGIKAFIEDKILVINTPDQQFEMEQEALALQGTHNLYNTMASAISANIAHIRKEEIRLALSSFQGVEHRLEKVASVAGVEYINDSKATNVNSCWYALESVKTPVVLILGGTDKGNDYSEIEALVRQKVKAIVCLGVDNTKLHEFFEGKVNEIRDARSMKEAVNLAGSLASKGDTVLLSPCCASFDLFENYEDRGRQFKDYVRNL
ncbi:MAG: UDP-N-acetylmuramoyl-L-alanine--D-glutamate ligase [Bacteroidales bacterium]|nr:UDP-N-acetylmuramoyl-L-alanine--D-glutamate ligase [Bacteroidales bacterium]MDD4361522.1 UDP-N-acetylmuramoyl-L-alanine--D-glutamate ligase [Bacteroidales bacterium]MDD4429896.1 UDP-N-acetylmuramoyl-L-alanine--D-glutamate ligase [Bacteroidales bacterium]